MRKKLGRVFAFAVATVLIAESMTMSAPTQAAEGSEEGLEVILEEEYSDWKECGDKLVFSTKSLDSSTKATYTAGDRVVIVDNKGNKEVISNSDESENAKYKNIYDLDGNGIVFVKENNKMILLCEDGKWLKNNDEGFDSIDVLGENHYLVNDGEYYDVVNSQGNIILNIVIGSEYEIVDNIRFGNGYFLKISNEETNENKYVVFNKNYNLLENFIPEGYSISDVVDAEYYVEEKKFLLICKDGDKSILIDKELNKKDIPDVEGYTYVGLISTIFYDNAVEVTYYKNSDFSSSDNVKKTVFLEDMTIVNDEDEKNLTKKEMSNSDLDVIWNSYGDYGDCIYTKNGQMKYSQKYMSDYFASYFKENEEKYEFDERNNLAFISPVAITDNKLILKVDCIDNILDPENSDTAYTVGAILYKKDGYALDKAEIFYVENEYDLMANQMYGGKLTVLSMNGKTYINGIEFSEVGHYGLLSDEVFWVDVAGDGCHIYNNNNKEILYISMEQYDSRNRPYVCSDALIAIHPDGNNDVYSLDGDLLLSTEKDVEYYKNGLMVTYTDGKYGLMKNVSSNSGTSNGSTSGGGNSSQGTTTGGESTSQKPEENKELISKIETAEKNEVIDIAVEKGEQIKSDIFEAAKGKDVTLTIETESGAKWTIKGSDITGTSLKDIDLTVEEVKDVVPQEAIKSVKVEGEVVELSLAHTGDFGFTAELTINLKKENKDKYANLFYYNPSSKALEFMESVKIDDNGEAGFTYTHASDYVILISDNEYKIVAEETGESAGDINASGTEGNESSVSDNNKNVPPTGDSSGVGTAIILMVLSLVMLGFVVIKKKEAVNE